MRGISKTVLFLSLASFFADIASEAIYPLLPIFLTSVLGLSVIWLGLIEGISESVSSITKVFAGTLSDRMRKQKVFVIFGYTLSTMRSLIGFSTSAPQVLSIRLVDRLGKGIRTAPRDAWLSRQATKESLGRVFGFHRGMDNLGAAIAPLLATIFLIFYPGEIRTLFLLTIVPGLVSLYFVYRAMKEPSATKQAEVPVDQVEWKDLLHFPPHFYRTMFLFFLFALGASADSFLILKLHDLGLPIAYVPLVWMALNAMKSAAAFWGGGVSDRVGARSALMVGWLVYTGCYGIFAFSDSIEVFLIAFLIYGFSYGLIEAPEKAMVAQMSTDGRKGTAFGFYHLTVGIAYLPANLVVGWLWTKYGSTFALLFSSLLALSASAGLLFCNKKSLS